MHASSSDVQQDGAADKPSPQALPLVIYNRENSSVTLSDAEYESAIGDSHYGSSHEVTLVPSAHFTVGSTE